MASGGPHVLRLGPELGLDAWSMQTMGADWHAGVVQSLADAGIRCGAHLPFLDLSPASLDDLVLEASRKRLRRGFTLAKVYGVQHMVGHPGYQSDAHGRHPDQWLLRSRETWKELLQSWPDHPPLYLENTFDREPGPLLELVQDLRNAELGPVGVCFDVGHWRGLIGGAGEADLERWLTALGPYIGHLHLHDNDGSGDQHLGMGLGDIPWDFFFGWLRDNGVRPTMTFEPHSLADMEQTLRFVQQRLDVFQSIMP